MKIVSIRFYKQFTSLTRDGVCAVGDIAGALMLVAPAIAVSPLILEVSLAL